MIEELYQEVILDHFRNPHNYGEMKNPDIKAHDVNTSCGDEITITAKADNAQITDVKFSGKGCAISQAAASMLTDEVKGKSLEEVVKFNKAEMLSLLNIPVSGMRLKCALLALKVLKVGIVKFMGEQNDG